MRTLFTAAVMAVLASVPVSAQNLTLDFSALAAKARAKHEVTLDAAALQMLRQGGNKGDKDKSGDLAKVFSEIQGVSVRNYEFAKEGEYSDRDLEPLHRQVGDGSGWTRIVNVKEDSESAEIYVYNQGGKPAGMLIIAAEAKELSVIHIAGSVQLAQLKDIVDSTIHYDMTAANARAKE